VADGYDSLLRVARNARQRGRAIFPLSAMHYVEMSGIRDSGFQVLLGRVTIAQLEVDAMLDVLLGLETIGAAGCLAWPILRMGFRDARRAHHP
jgi:hypothetical protein